MRIVGNVKSPDVIYEWPRISTGQPKAVTKDPNRMLMAGGPPYLRFMAFPFYSICC